MPGKNEPSVVQPKQVYRSGTFQSSTRKIQLIFSTTVRARLKVRGSFFKLFDRCEKMKGFLSEIILLNDTLQREFCVVLPIYFDYSKRCQMHRAKLRNFTCGDVLRILIIPKSSLFVNHHVLYFVFIDLKRPCALKLICSAV